MYEYIFFDRQIQQQFVRDLEQHQIAIEPSGDESVVGVSEDISDQQSDWVDGLYERLLQQTAEQMQDGLETDVAGVQVVLQDGNPCTIRLDSDLVSRMLTAISMEELRDLCQVITQGVERQDNSPLCHPLEP